MSQHQSLRKSVLPPVAVPSEASQQATGTPAVPFPPPSLSNGSEEGGDPPSIDANDRGLLYKPTEAQARVKARFWARWSETPLAAPVSITMAQAQQITGSSSLASWWGRPGFKEWFLATSVTEERLDYLLHLALTAAEDVLLNIDPKAQSARVQMIKTVAEMAGKLQRGGPNAQEQMADKKRKAIEAMGKEELVKLLEGQGIRIEQKVASIDVPYKTEDEK